MTPANHLEITVACAEAWNKNLYLVRTKIFLLAVLCAFSSMALAQGGHMLFSLGPSIPQNTQLNASYQLPLGFVGLPLVSGPGFHVNNRFNFSQAFERSANGAYRLNVESALGQMSEKNIFLLKSRIPLIYIGTQLEKSGTSLSFFVNERLFAGIQYQKELVEILWKGTDVLLGQKVNLRNTLVSSTYFREYGAGFHAPLGKRLLLGLRIKLIQGFYNIRSTPGMNASVYVHPDTYAYNFAFEKAGINSAGISNLNSVRYMTSNRNRGLAMDAGVNWKKNRRFTFSAAINDIGFVKWKRGTQTFQVPDTVFTFRSIEMENTGEISSALDSLEKRFAPSKSRSPYTSKLSGLGIVSGSMLLNETDQLSILLMNQLLMERLQTSVSIAYKKCVSDELFVSGALVKYPQHWPRPGGAIVYKKRSLQLFLASDNLLGFFNVSGARILDLQFGINLYGVASTSK